LLDFCRTVSQNELNSMPWFYYKKNELGGILNS
jgi:hypothetical protein